MSHSTRYLRNGSEIPEEHPLHYNSVRKALFIGGSLDGKSLDIKNCITEYKHAPPIKAGSEDYWSKQPESVLRQTYKFEVYRRLTLHYGLSYWGTRNNEVLPSVFVHDSIPVEGIKQLGLLVIRQVFEGPF